ncbi:MAG: dUTP diphosphatase [Clostridiales Family XIII bacterium]|jgi:dUTP pyrophosphatase|nr:dUTP diphosphatase [Clostridiales Family XIII bacterium]
MSVKIKIKSSTGEIPKRETTGASGYDLKAYIKNSIILKPMEIKLIPTGIFFEIKKGYEGQVRPRSGLSLKHAITLINAVGTIDSDYRGEIKIPLINLSDKNYEIKNGDRIAQIIFTKVIDAEFVDEKITETSRGENGFGSTGLK